ncbi:hypothetical protein Ait01nite_089830 [Actinoplanes italicus]|uniref:Uncharacterized protein n=1 Tax=Actinoplanes italicus TaxID=113567 RepID=A0A2T0JIJ2_9ACTN|nr:hypothetical protein [Actinoplanes italicus]PRX07400.1 hypothetical protein CLV67_14275 [Actinoplanes italicus]GIE35938.1 hypothetical protein Ait01nite_089830 [Actinoplanes italicus]
MSAPTTYANPYWDKVKDSVTIDHWDKNPVVGGIGMLDKFTARHDLVSEYAWTITDPATVAFVVEHCGPQVVDPLAGSGYWAWLLGQHGIDVAASDLKPGASQWHSHGVHLPVVNEEGPIAVRATGPERTLLLSWPPYSDPIGARLVQVYRGDRIVYIGEGPYGCCGDDDMWERLESGWTEVASHRPVQWHGLRDWVTVYERAGGVAR